jgi:hypothetical protein
LKNEGECEQNKINGIWIWKSTTKSQIHLLKR